MLVTDIKIVLSWTTSGIVQLYVMFHEIVSLLFIC